jgi:hypothetical protein
MFSQVSLEDTMQDEHPKLDPVTAVYMVGGTVDIVPMDESETLKRNFFENDRPSEIGRMLNTLLRCRTSER